MCYKSASKVYASQSLKTKEYKSPDSAATMLRDQVNNIEYFVQVAGYAAGIWARRKGEENPNRDETSVYQDKRKALRSQEASLA